MKNIGEAMITLRIESEIVELQIEGVTKAGSLKLFHNGIPCYLSREMFIMSMNHPEINLRMVPNTLNGAPYTFLR